MASKTVKTSESVQDRVLNILGAILVCAMTAGLITIAVGGGMTMIGDSEFEFILPLFVGLFIGLFSFRLIFPNLFDLVFGFLFSLLHIFN